MSCINWRGSSLGDIRSNSYRMRRHTELSKAIHLTAAQAISAERAQQQQNG